MKCESLLRHILLEAAAFTLSVIEQHHTLTSRKRCGPLREAGRDLILYGLSRVGWKYHRGSPGKRWLPGLGRCF